MRANCATGVRENWKRRHPLSSTLLFPIFRRQYPHNACLFSSVLFINSSPLLVQTRRFPISPVAFRQPLACLVQLHTVDILLEQHDGRARQRESPRDGAIHLVGSGHLHRGGRERVREEHGRLWCGGRARVEGGGLGGIPVGGKQGGRDDWGGETEEVEGDEEELVQGASGKEDPL